MSHPDYTIVCSAADHNVPILLLPEGYALLRDHEFPTHHKPAGHIERRPGGCRTNRLFEGELTDEEQALAFRLMLIGE